MNNKNHKNDVFQVAIQLLVVTTKEIYMRTQAVCAISFSLNFFCSQHNQLNSDLKGIMFVMLAVHEQVALMSSS